MGVNEERPTEAESAEMRDIVLAGTQRIHPAGRHRRQFIAGALALVLIGGVSGGAVATSLALRDQPRVLSSPVPAETDASSPEPTPEPTTAPDGSAIEAFGGDCAAALTEAEVSEAVGEPMVPLAAQWNPGAEGRLGGIGCAWTTRDEYLGMQVRMWAYPSTVVREAGIPGQVGCDELGSSTICRATGVIGDPSAGDEGVTWVAVTVTGSDPDGGAVDPDPLRAAAADVLSIATGRVSESRPRAAEWQDDWWLVEDCASIVADLVEDGALAAGSEVLDSATEVDQGQATTIPYALGTARWCSVEGGPSFQLWPGGGDAFADILALEATEPLAMDGAVGAAVAPSLDAYEGHYPEVVVTDGTNLLAVSGSEVDAATGDDIAFAQALLEVMADR